MSGFYYKFANEQKKAKAVYYKHDNVWNKVKALRYKHSDEWTRNLLQDMEISYSTGTTQFTRYGDYAEIRTLPDTSISQIGMAFNNAVDFTSITNVRFLYNQHQSGNISGTATFSIYNQMGGNRDQFTIKTDSNAFGNDLSTGLSTASYTGEYFIRVHLLMNPSIEEGAFRFVQLKTIYVTENGTERILWNAGG